MTTTLHRGHRRFNHRPSPAYLRAVEALRVVAEAERNATRAFAEAVAEDWQELYAKRYGLRPSNSTPCLHRLFGRRCSQTSAPYRDIAKDGLPCSPPGCDHASLWLKDGKPFSYVTQPYGLSWAMIAELVDFCRRWELKLHIESGLSWHFPGATVFVELTRAGTLQQWEGYRVRPA